VTSKSFHLLQTFQTATSRTLEQPLIYAASTQSVGNSWVCCSGVTDCCLICCSVPMHWWCSQPSGHRCELYGLSFC